MRRYSRCKQLWFLDGYVQSSKGLMRSFVTWQNCSKRLSEHTQKGYHRKIFVSVHRSYFHSQAGYLCCPNFITNRYKIFSEGFCCILVVFHHFQFLLKMDAIGFIHNFVKIAIFIGNLKIQTVCLRIILIEETVCNLAEWLIFT